MLARRLLIVSSSAALHFGSAALVLLLTGTGDRSPIFIDLVSDAQTIEPERLDPAPAAPPRAVITARRPQADRPMVPARSEAPASSGPVAAPAPRDEKPPASSPGAEPPGEARAEARQRVEATPPPGSGSGEPAPALTARKTPLAMAELSSEIPVGGDGRGADGRGVERGGGEAGEDGGGSGSRAGPMAGGSSSSGSEALREPQGGGAGPSLATAGEGRDAIPAEYGPYLQGFRRRVQESLEYPLSARRRGLSGTVELEVLLESSGRVSAVRLISSSSHAVLDDAALRAVQGLAAEPFPARLPRRPLRIRLPLTFELR
jgi:periplasmic protein TonB